jgi:PAS domain S-box-containing protein
VTVKKQEWLKQMESVLETLNEGVAVTDERGHIVFVNKCMERLFEAPRSALIGKTAQAFYSGEDYEFTLARRALIKGGGYDRYEFFVPRADGTRVPVIISSRNREDNDGHRFSVVTCTDIFEQKQAEQRLQAANLQLEHRAEEIERELTLASRVQKSLAPQPLHWGQLAVETYCRPASTIGGDFGLAFPYDGMHLDLLIGDVSGHGIGAALMANRIYTETVTLLRQGMELGEMLRTLNRFVIENIGVSGYMFTVAAARLDQTGRELIYAAAGHPPGLLISPSGELRQIEPRSTVLGTIKEAVPQEASEEFKLSPGDRLILYSDGLIEVWNRKHEVLGVEGLGKIAQSIAVLPLPAMRQAIIQGVTSYSAGIFKDDVSLVLVEVR